MAPTVPTVPPTPSEDSSLPTAAIVLVAIGAYIVIFVTGVFIRQCLLSRGLSICPEWINEMCCASGSCCSCACVTHLAELCDFKVPSKHSCLDTCCPTKETCDDTFCCCMNSVPGGALCDDCTGPECECGDCNCACNCQMPECNSVNCLCFEIQLRQPGAQRVPGGGVLGNNAGQPGYYGPHQPYPGQQMSYPNPALA